MKKTICFILSLVLALSILGGCKHRNTDSPSSGVDSVSDGQTANDPAGTGDEPGVTDDPIDDIDITDDPAEDIVFPDDPAEDIDPDTPYITNLQVHNGQAPVISNYRGASGTVYHAFGFMKDENSGRVYTDKMMNTELNRLVDYGTRYVRTRYQSDWMWSNATGWNFNADRFNYFCDYAKAMQDRNISVLLQIGWHFGFVTKLDSVSIGEVSYLDGNGADRYGESVGVNFSGMTSEEQRMTKSARRFGYWIAETLRQCKAKGINNISHLLYFVEPSNGYSGSYTGHANKEYVAVCRAIKQKLQEEGVVNWVQHMGPNETTYSEALDESPNTQWLLPYVVKNAPELFDVYTSHCYPKSNDPTNDVYYELMDPIFNSYKKTMVDANLWGKKEFWMDEFDVDWNNAPSDANNGSAGLQYVVGTISAQQKGFQNIVYWQLFDQLWTDNTSSGGEWRDGIHVCGAVPSLFESATPRDQYYIQGLFTRYNGYKNGKVYQTNVAELAEEYAGIYVGAVQLEDGNWSISVVNMNIDDATVVVNFDKAINDTLYRHVQCAGTIKATPSATLAPADKTYVSVQDKFIDTIPGGSVAIYTGVRG